jgi:hypothetical protein
MFFIPLYSLGRQIVFNVDLNHLDSDEISHVSEICSDWDDDGDEIETLGE